MLWISPFYRWSLVTCPMSTAGWQWHAPSPWSSTLPGLPVFCIAPSIDSLLLTGERKVFCTCTNAPVFYLLKGHTVSVQSQKVRFAIVVFALPLALGSWYLGILVSQEICIDPHWVWEGRNVWHTVATLQLPVRLAKGMKSAPSRRLNRINALRVV